MFLEYFMSTECKEFEFQDDVIAEMCPFPNIV